MKLRVGLLLLAVVGLLAWIWGRGQVPSTGSPQHKAPPGGRPIAVSQERNALSVLRAAPEAVERGPKKVTQPLVRELCVQDANGEVVQHLALVLYCSDTSSPLPGGSVITGEDGCVQVSLCSDPEAVTCARISDPRHRPATAWVLDSTESSYDVALAAPALVSGEVRGPGGDAIAGAQLWMEAQDPDRWSAPPFLQMRVRSDEHGGFRFVAARPVPCDPCVRDEQDCELQRRVDEPDAPVPGTIWIRHPAHGLKAVPIADDWGAMMPIVMDGRRAGLGGELTGHGAQRAKIMLRHETRRRDRQVTNVDASGQFEFWGLGAGAYELSVFLDGQRMMRIPQVDVGDTLSLRLQNPE